MKEATLIAVAPGTHVPPPLEGKEKTTLDAFYSKYGVLDKGPNEKIEALKKAIQARSFFALGGNETPEMELRANERIFLLKHAEK